MKSSYTVKQPSIFGRLGTGIGRGLAETLPKEMERGRLAEGLKLFETEAPNLSPMQQLTRLASIPGALDKPQLIQSIGELARIESAKRGFRGSERGEPALPQKESPSSALKDVRFANLPERNISRSGEIENDNIPREAIGQPQILPKNPLREETKTVIPPSPQQFEEALSRNWDRFPNMTFQEVAQKTQQDFERQQAMPLAERQEDERLKAIQAETRDKFNNSLGLKLQKEKGKETFQDITGEMQNNLIRGLEHDLARNPSLSVDDLVNKWTDKALNLAKTKTQLGTLSGQGNWNAFLKQGETIEKLKNYQKSFRDADNLEEYYKILKSDFGMSPHAAAQIAWPRSDTVKKAINSIKDISYVNQIADSKKIATQIEDALTRNDSILAISKNIKDVYPDFNQRAFFQQLSEDRDRLSLSDLQKRELDEGMPDWLPNWGDTWFFPNWRGLNK